MHTIFTHLLSFVASLFRLSFPSATPSLAHMKCYLRLLFLFAATSLTLTLSADAQKNDTNPLGSFSFDFKRLGKNPAEQVQTLKKIGFSGATLTFRDNFKAFSKEVRNNNFEIYAAHKALHIGQKTKFNSQQISHLVDQVKNVNADFWLIILEKKGDKASTALLLETINKVADICAKKGVRCVLYPHDNTLIESAEDAIDILKKSRRKDLFISFHLCHEIRAGNGNRLSEVAKKVKPYLRLASISGANTKYVDNSQDWSKTIQPLDMGTYDTSKFIEALQSIDYKGPIILHTFALDKVAADHHQRSFKKYQELFSKQ
jgi:sugar phosphate isomerase/epimerase